jgi:hypothetical protein
MVDGLRANSQTQVALYEHPCALMVTVLALDQDLAVVAATGVVAVAIVAMTAQVGATSRAPIVQHALGPSMVVLRHRHADELVESDKPSGGILATCFSF